MSESIKEMEDRWLVLMAAKDARTGERIYDNDSKYRRDVFALRTQIEERKTAEAPGAQIAAHQLKQFEWLDRASAARDKDGKRLAESNLISGNTLQQNLIKARASVLEGRLLTPEFIANSERLFAEAGVTMPPDRTAAPVYDTTPVAPLAQATNSFIKGSK